MTTAKDIVDALGRPEIQQKLGIGTQSVTNCIAGNEFPARYYGGMKELADARGVELPLDLFNWRRAEDAA